MNLAVIKTGGKQYKVTQGQVLKVEKLVGEKGDKINFDQVLLMAKADGSEVVVGQPTVEGKTIEAEILEQGRDRKVRVVKYKAKVRYHKVYGHRQHFTKVKISGLEQAVTSAPKKATVKKTTTKKTATK